jgi:1-acyl-sn-glycerol-3-phosphate acyltransferase
LEIGVFVSSDIVQRTLVVLAVKLRPGSRDRILTRWVRSVNGVILGVIRLVAGARIEIAARIPFAPGTLVLMNHQSLLDIPLVIECTEAGYPIIVARARYAKGYPLISHTIRLYGHPTVRPGEHASAQLEALQRAALTTTRPLVLYPEGSRSRDGGIRPFKRAGLGAILAARSWSVHVLVGDGLYGVADLRGFVTGIGGVRVRVQRAGPFAFDHRRDDAEVFISSMEKTMRDKLAEMRSSAAVA